MTFEQAAQGRMAGLATTDELDWDAVCADQAPRVYNYFRCRLGRDADVEELYVNQSHVSLGTRYFIGQYASIGPHNLETNSLVLQDTAEHQAVLRSAAILARLTTGIHDGCS